MGMAIQIQRAKTLRPLDFPLFTIRSFSFASSPPPTGLPPLTAEDEAVVSSAVTILLVHRSKRRWSYIKSLHPPAALSAAQLAHILLRIRHRPRLALRLFLLSDSREPVPFAAAAHVLARHRQRSAALELLLSAIRSLDPSSSSSDGDHPPAIFRTLANTYRAFNSAPFVFDLLIRAYLRTKRLDRAVQILLTLRSRGIHPLVGTANALIRSASLVKGSSAGFELYKEIFRPEAGDGVRARVSPNVGTFNTLLLAFYREGNLGRTKQIMEEMESFNCESNVFTYSVLMAGFCDEGMVEKSRELWEEMIGRGIKPDIMAFNTLISGYCAAGEMEMAEELYKEMVLSKIEPTGNTFQHLIQGHFKVGNVDPELILYSDMKRRGFDMEVTAVDELLDVMSKRGRTAEGLSILRDEMRREEFAPSRRSYEVLIRGRCEEGEIEEAMKLQAEMAGKGYGNSLEVYNAFIKGYETRGDVEKVRRLKAEMLETGMSAETEED